MWSAVGPGGLRRPGGALSCRALGPRPYDPSGPTWVPVPLERDRSAVRAGGAPACRVGSALPSPGRWLGGTLGKDVFPGVRAGARGPPGRQTLKLTVG